MLLCCHARFQGTYLTGTPANRTCSQKYAAREIEKEIDGDSVPSIPAPLAISPSRARRQLEARLAEKLQVADTGPVDFGEESITKEPGEVEATSPPFSTRTQGVSKGKRSVSFDEPETQIGGGKGGGFAEGFRGFEDEDGDNGSSSSSSGSDEVEVLEGLETMPESVETTTTTPTGAGLQRQTTREAVERRPLDDGDEDGYAATNEQNVYAAAGSGSATGGAAESPLPTRQWHWPAKASDDYDDDEDEDTAIEMGTKYMRRRTSGH